MSTHTLFTGDAVSNSNAAIRRRMAKTERERRALAEIPAVATAKSFLGDVLDEIVDPIESLALTEAIDRLIYEVARHVYDRRTAA